MIQDPQEYLEQWEKENNPFYPNEMRWDRVKVNTFLKEWKKQCNIHDTGKSFYCQSEIEMDGKCDKQCEHCKEYYKSLEQ